MKLSISLPDDDVEFLDAYAENEGIASRSAVMHKAVRMLRASQLGDSYADAWKTWEKEGLADLWSTADSDELTD